MSRRNATGGENAAVVTAAVDIARGGTILADMVRLESVPKRWANPKAISKIEEAVGRVVTIPILEGEPVLASKIAAKGAGVGLAAIIPKGMRAFTIQTPTIATGVAGFILPGNKVDVLLTVKEVGGGTEMPAAAPSSCSRISRSWPSTSGSAPNRPRRKRSVPPPRRCAR